MLSNVAVIGAGVSGLTAAYALKKIGIEIDVFERSESIKEFGAGITLSKNATILLQDIGLMDSLSSKGHYPMGSYIRDYKKAKVIKSKRFDKNFITLDRRDLDLKTLAVVSISTVKLNQLILQQERSQFLIMKKRATI